MKSKLNSTAYVSVLFTFIFSFAACSQGPSNADEFSVSSVQAGENVTQPSSKESAATDSVFAPPPESPTPLRPIKTLLRLRPRDPEHSGTSPNCDETGDPSTGRDNGGSRAKREPRYQEAVDQRKKSQRPRRFFSIRTILQTHPRFIKRRVKIVVMTWE